MLQKHQKNGKSFSRLWKFVVTVCLGSVNSALLSVRSKTKRCVIINFSCNVVCVSKQNRCTSEANKCTKYGKWNERNFGGYSVSWLQNEGDNITLDLAIRKNPIDFNRNKCVNLVHFLLPVLQLGDLNS
ncbi:hypothetical protein FKM82_007272 [Ascaphus truei]